jgi:hypothetical protein
LTVGGQVSAVSNQRSAISGQQSAVSNQRSAISGQQSAVSNQRSAISRQQSAVSNQPSAISRQQSAVSFRHSAVGIYSLVDRRCQPERGSRDDPRQSVRVFQPHCDCLGVLFGSPRFDDDLFGHGPGGAFG